MISFIDKWLRRRAVSASPPPVTWSYIGVGGSRTSAEEANDEMLQQIFRQMAKGTFFEIRYD